MWTDVTILIPHEIGSTESETVDFTIFVAIGTPPEYGLDGVLSICVTPLTYDWYEVSLMGKIEEKYTWNTIYISYSFPRKDNIYHGQVEFSSTSAAVEKSTYGGSASLSDSMLGDPALFSLKKVKPFLDLDMPQISFKSVQL